MLVRRVLWLLCAVVSALLLVTQAQASTPPPAVVLGLSQAGADYIASVALPPLVKELSQLKLPSHSGSSHDFDYTLNNIQISQMSYSNVSVDLSGTDIVATISGVTVDMAASWSAEFSVWPHEPSGSGTVNTHCTQSSILVKATVSAASGEPKVAVQGIAVQLNNLSVDVSGSAWDWLIDIIKGLFADTIRAEAETAVDGLLTTLINNAANAALQTLPLSVPLADSMVLDLHVYNQPVQKQNSFFVPSQGAVVNQTNPVYPPLPHTTLPVLAPAPDMLSVVVDQYVVNSGFWLSQSKGLLDVTVGQKEVPASFPFQLNTSTFRAILPALYYHFPNDGIELTFNTTRAPAISLSGNNSTAAKAEVAFTMEWSAVGNGTQAAAFTLQCDLQLSVAFKVSGNTVQMAFSYVDFNASLLSSRIGPVNTSALDTLLLALVQGPGVSELNKYLGTGIPLPVVAGVTLVNPTVRVDLGYIVVAADLKWAPSEAVMCAMAGRQPGC